LLSINKLSAGYGQFHVLHEVSLDIPDGGAVAVIGSNGAGKSTLVKLIAHLYDPDQGRIVLDGVDLRGLSPDAVHDQIAFVFQSFGRYEASAADNIAYGDWTRLLGDRERVMEIAKLAGVHETVSALPAAARHWELPASFHFLSARKADDVLRVVRAYEVPFERDDKTGDVSHPGLVFVVDADGRLAYTFNNPSPAWIRDALGLL